MESEKDHKRSHRAADKTKITEGRVTMPPMILTLFSTLPITSTHDVYIYISIIR